MQNQETPLCIYCNQPATYQFKNGKWCCSPHMNGCPEIKRQRKESATKQWKKAKDLGFEKLLENKKEQIFTPNVCAYCGQYAKYQLKNGKWCCKKSANSCPTNVKKNSEKIKSMYSEDGKLFNGKIKEVYYSEESRQKQGWNRGLSKYTDKRLKKQSETLHQKYESRRIDSCMGW